MKKLDAKELTKSFNELRINKLGHTFTAKDLQTLLVKYGFNGTLTYVIKKELFNCIRSKTTLLYQFQDTPVYVGKMENIISRYRMKNQKNKNEEVVSEKDKALNLLKKEGYVISKCIGFDEERFKHDYPDLYEQYLIYEAV